METVVDYLFVLLLAQNLKISENDNVLHPYKRFSSYLIFCIIFEERYFSCYILLIDHISLIGYLYFVRYWAICVLQLLVNQVVTS